MAGVEEQAGGGAGQQAVGGGVALHGGQGGVPVGFVGGVFEEANGLVGGFDAL